MIRLIFQAIDLVQRDSEAAVKILRLSVCHMLKSPPLEDRPERLVDDEPDRLLVVDEPSFRARR